jgi:enhancer of mRNA-decapping protein 4
VTYRGFRSTSNSSETNPPLTDYGGDQSALEYTSDRRMDTGKDNMTNVPPSGDNLRKGDKNAVHSDISIASQSSYNI